MSDDPFDDPEWQRYAQQAREGLEPQVRDSAVGVSLFNGTVDPKIAIETGYMVLLDKPIILVVTPGVKVPDKMARIADVILEGQLGDPDLPGRIQEAIMQVLKG